ncbi:MAG: PAS domain S-box protein [Caldiserica bacterium]|nr:PAS domain S-box protein [Caldisericota bacterium]MDH7562849.1 PAS domain S-box protein [Caldisericota bacterium]
MGIEDLFRKIVETSNEGVIAIDPQGSIILANHQMEVMLGYGKGELLGLHARDLVWETELPDFVDHWLKLQQGLGGRYKRTLKRKDGSPTVVLVSANPIIEQGEFKGAFALVGEFSQYQQISRELFSAIEELKTLEVIVNRSPAVAFVWKPEEGLPVQYVSENVSQFGYQKEEFESGTLVFTDIIHPEDRERVVQEGREFRKEGRNEYFQHYRIITKDGKIRWVDDRTIVNRSPSGEVLNTYGIILDVTSRVLMEEEALEAEAKLRAFLEASPDLIYLKDTEGRNLLVNTAYAHYFGLQPGDINGKKDSEIMPPGLTEQCAQSDRLVIQKNEPIRAEEKIQNEKGERVFDTIKFPIKGAYGKVRGIGGISRDITELRRASEALKKQGEFLKLILDHAQDLIYRYRLFPEPGFEYVSPSATRITGYTPEEHYADPYLGMKIVHPEDRPILEALRNDPVSFQKPVEFRWVKKDGTIFWTEQINTPVFDETGRVVAIVGIARDITEQKKAQEKIIESERNLRAFLEALKEPAVLLNTEGEILFANKNASLRLGLPPLENSHCCLWDFLSGELEKKLKPLVLNAVEGKGPISGEIGIEDRTFLLQVYPWETEDGRVEKVVLLMIDITERIRVEGEKEKVKNALIYSVSHDLKTPLMVMEASLDLISSSDPERREEKFLEYSILFRNNLNRMKGLVENLLLSQRAILSEIKPSPQTVNVFKMFGETVSEMRTLARSLGVELEEKTSGEPLFIEFDPELVRRALENIISNAIKFSKKGQKVTVSLEREDHELRFVVEDKGPGIKKEEMEGLSQPFRRLESAERSNIPGTGLGLFVARKLVEAHGGKLVLESSPGMGTKAIISLPIK